MENNTLKKPQEELPSISIEEKVYKCLQDYGNDFLALDIYLQGSKIEGVKELFKNGHKILTVEEYLEKYKKEGRETISIEDQNSSFFIEKVKLLDELANKINSLGENIDEQELNEIITKVKEIIYN